MTTLSSSSHQQWHVLGLGAIGGLFACRLQAAGIPVMACPSPSHSNHPAVNLTLEEHGVETTYVIPVDAKGPITHLLLTTKAQQSEAALRGVEHRLQRDTVVVVLQNGLGVQNWLQAHWPHLHIIAGTTTEGVNRPTTHHLRHAGYGTTWIGPWRTIDEHAAQAVASAWQPLSLNLAYDPAIATRLWEKLVMNCAINPLTALLDCRNGALAGQTETQQVMRAVVDEVSRLMQYCGQAADADRLYQRVIEVSHSTGANISSMLADQRSGRATEIDYINGYVSRASREHGLSAPVNRWLVECVVARRRFTAASLLAAMPTPQSS